MTRKLGGITDDRKLGGIPDDRKLGGITDDRKPCGCQPLPPALEHLHHQLPAVVPPPPTAWSPEATLCWC